MAKIGIISFNLIAILLYNLFLGGNVTVVQNMPDEIYAGQVFTIDVKITKGDQFGFAKWQQSIPEGFVAEAVDTQGATFSFKNNEVKLIWMALPEFEEFTIRYRLKTDSSISGEFSFDGKFSFIENNERNDVLAEIHTLVVKPNAEMPEGLALEVKNDLKEIKKETVSLEVDEKVTDSKDIQINRKINHLGKGNYEVSLTINKGKFSSFGKIEEYLPPGFKAYPLYNNDGFFSFSNNVMKILWMTLPSEESYTIRYGMESFTNEFDTVAVHGAFSYLDGESSKQIPVKGSWFKNYFTSPEREIAEKTPEPIKEEVVEVTEAVDEIEEETEEIMEEVAEIAPEEEEEELESEIADIPAPETSVSYKVQIAAAKREVGQEYFIERHGVKETVSIEFHKSWYKYTIGAFGIYKEARDKRNNVWATDNKINDAFVTAYNSGERISVQEALMITKQKWYK